jgi:hypothetical protein
MVGEIGFEPPASGLLKRSYFEQFECRISLATDLGGEVCLHASLLRGSVTLSWFVRPLRGFLAAGGR